MAAARRVYIGRSLRQHGGGGSYRRTSGGEDTLFFARHWGQEYITLNGTQSDQNVEGGINM